MSICWFCNVAAGSRIESLPLYAKCKQFLHITISASRLCMVNRAFIFVLLFCVDKVYFLPTL